MERLAGTLGVVCACWIAGCGSSEGSSAHVDASGGTASASGGARNFSGGNTNASSGGATSSGGTSGSGGVSAPDAGTKGADAGSGGAGSGGATVVVDGHCHDAVKNGNEVDVDCGGRCPGCPAGTACSANADCESYRCENGECARGPAKARCTTGAECVSDVCNDDGRCAPPDHCSSLVKDEDETGVDCGGSCRGCGFTSACNVDSDCLSMICKDHACESATCTDGLRNNGETDVDCGPPDASPIGGKCPLCEVGQGCQTHAACKSGACIGGVCQAPSCTDGVTNGDETSDDCGGSCPDKCQAGASCLEDADCRSGACIIPLGQNYHACKSATTCADKALNGTETDIDCGGPSCSPCSVGQACASPLDCWSRSCVAGTCTCNDSDCPAPPSPFLDACCYSSGLCSVVLDGACVHP